ncbi:MAG: hypothetical protein K6G65_10020 [Lachnospiraceae bacterium]|nr:hypothetical protein [Lachnospiraceae bacterium]
MEEIYTLIENKIKEAGYAGVVDGFEIYQEISDQIEGKENGSYLFMVKKTDTCFFEYKIDVFDEEFNLSYIDIHEGEKVLRVDFDE